MIEIEGVTKRYDENTVVDDVSFVVAPGTICVIVGTSGSGKTTLMRMVNRLVEPTRGIVKIDGEDNRNVPAFELRRRIGYAIQGHGLFPHRTVAQNIGTVPTLLGWDKAKIADRVEELLDLFQLNPGTFANRYPQELSGGQQQRVGVARALAAKPNILLMDEPYGALDPVIRGKAQEDLLAIQRRTGTTIILVTHDMEEAIHLGNKIAVMDGGKLVQYATPQEILAKPANDFVQTLIGTADRPFRLLSLSAVSSLVEEGKASGDPISGNATQREAFAELLWSGREALPVSDQSGQIVGRVTIKSLIEHAARPAA